MSGLRWWLALCCLFPCFAVDTLGLSRNAREVRYLYILLTCLLLVHPQLANAQDNINVRSPSQVEISAKKTPEGTTVLVVLQDNLNGNLEGQAVTLQLTPVDGIGGSYEDDKFIYGGVAEFPLEPLLASKRLRFTSYKARAVFPGNDLYEQASAEAQIDITKDTPTLEIEATSELALDETEAILIARLTLLGKPIPGALISLSGIKAPKSEATDESGEATFTFSPRELPLEGPNTIIIRFPGGDLYNPIETRRTMSLVAPVTVTLSGPRSVSADEDLELSGSLMTPRGALSKKGVAFFAQISQGEERPLGNTVTDSEGNFAVALAANIFKKDTTVEVIARFTPDAPWLRPGDSAPVSFRVLPPKPVPAAFYLVPLFICGAVAFGMFLLRVTRQKTIQKPIIVKPRTGLILNHRQSLGPEESSVSGAVKNAKTLEPLAGVLVLLQYEDKTTLEVTTDARGEFRFEDTPRGRPSLVVRAVGYVSEEVRIETPHRGKYRGVTLAILPVREKVLEIFREVAMEVLPEAKHWGTWTPREIRRYAREKKYHVKGPIGELVLLFESVYFAGVIGDETLIAKANELSTEARNALAPTSPA